MSDKETAAIYRHAATCEDCRLLLADIARPASGDDSIDAQLVARIEHRVQTWRLLGRVPFTVQAPLRQGDLVDRFLVVRRVGDAGLGAVYEAYDPKLEDRVVLKLLYVDEQHRIAAANLSETLTALSGLTHPNLLRIHSVGQYNEQIFLTAEFVKGVPLARMFGNSLPWREILQLFAQAGRGLAAAHEAGVVHGCFNADSCIVGQDGRVRVVDFAIADTLSSIAETYIAAPPIARQFVRPESADGSPFNPEDSYVGYLPAGYGLPQDLANQDALGEEPILGGTPSELGQRLYMAPEQLRGGESDARSDQFAFCAALFHALYHEPPFAGDTIAGWVHEVLRGRVRRVVDENIPEHVRKAILRGLRVNPAERHSSMRALIERLEGGSRQTSRRQRVIMAAAAVAVVAGVGGGLAAQAALSDDGRGADCEAVQSLDLAGIWDSARKESLRTATMAAGLPDGGEQWSALDRSLSEYANRWSTAAQSVCEPNSTALVSCVEQGRDSLRTLVDVLDPQSQGGSAADAETLSRGSAAVWALPDPAHCILPTSGRDGSADSQWALNMVTAAILTETGAYSDARELAKGVEQAARAANRPAWQAWARYHDGKVAMATGELSEAEHHLSSSVWMAQAHGQDTLAARGALPLVELSPEPRQSRYWASFAAATIERMAGLGNRSQAPGIQDMRSVLDRHTAVSLARQGQFAEAEQHASRALDSYMKRGDEQTPATADALYVLGNYQLARGAAQNALSSERRALDIYHRLYGPHHPRTGAAHVAVARVLLHTGKLDEAELAVEQALTRLKPGRKGLPARAKAFVVRSRIERLRGREGQAVNYAQRATEEYEMALGGTSPQLAKALLELGEGLLDIGRYSDAASAYEQAFAIWETAGRASAAQKAYAQLGQLLAEIGLKRGQGNDGERTAAEGMARLEATVQQRQIESGTSEPVTPWAYGHLGTVLAKAGDWPKALSYYQKALEAWQRQSTIDEVAMGTAMARVGLAQLAVGKSAEAKPLLEQVLVAAERVHLKEAPDVQYALARILWEERERARARALATAAKDGFLQRERDAEANAKARRVDDWLRQRDAVAVE